MIYVKLLYVLLPILIEGSLEQVPLPIESQAHRAGTETTQELSIDEHSIESVDPAQLLHYGARLPSGDVMVGIYIDDYGVLHVCPESKLCEKFGPDLDVIRRIHAAYAEASLERALEKGFGFDTEADPVVAPPATWSEGDGAPVPPRICDALLALLRSHRFKGTRRRRRLARQAPTDRWGYLITPLCPTALSTVRSTTFVSSISDTCFSTPYN